jgi:hypothetical protein
VTSDGLGWPRQVVIGEPAAAASHGWRRYLTPSPSWLAAALSSRRFADTTFDCGGNTGFSFCVYRALACPIVCISHPIGFLEVTTPPNRITQLCQQWVDRQIGTRKRWPAGGWAAIRPQSAGRIRVLPAKLSL